MERQERYGVYFILKSMEVGPSFRVAAPKYPTADAEYRIISRQRSRYTHYYFYIRDQVLGPIALCVGSCATRIGIARQFAQLAQLALAHFALVIRELSAV